MIFARRDFYIDTETAKKQGAKPGALIVMTVAPIFKGMSSPVSLTMHMDGFELVNVIGPGPSYMYGICCDLPTFASIVFTSHTNTEASRVITTVYVFTLASSAVTIMRSVLIPSARDTCPTSPVTWAAGLFASAKTVTEVTLLATVSV